MLSHDTARCPGDGSDAEGWREGCDDCLRRTSPAPADPDAVVAYMTPPLIVVFECEARIAPGEVK